MSAYAHVTEYVAWHCSVQDSALSTAPTPATVSADLTQLITDLPGTADLTNLINTLDALATPLLTTFPDATTQLYLAWIAATK